MLKPRALAITLFMMIGSLLCFAPAYAQSHTSFPGKKSISKSPNGKYVIHSVDGEKPDAPHHLDLEDVRTFSKIKLHSYEQTVDVIWSPGGARLIVNDHEGSNLTEAYVYIVDKTVRRINVTDELQQMVPESKPLFRNDHVYVEGISWHGEDRIKVKVSGHGDADPKGFEEFFEYTLDGGFKRVSK